MPFTVELCCNDWRNGLDLGYAESVELFDCTLMGGRVTTSWKREKVKDSNSAEGDETLRVGRLVVPCLAYRPHAGNWCWDAATVRLIHAVAIWNYLAQKKDWHCEEASSELFELFNAHGRIEPRTAPEFLVRILHPERVLREPKS